MTEPSTEYARLRDTLAAHFVMWQTIPDKGKPPGEWVCSCGLKFGFSDSAIDHVAEQAAQSQADFAIEHAWPGEVLTGLGDIWATCGCGARIDVPVEDGKTTTSGDVREAYRAHLVAAGGGDRG